MTSQAEVKRVRLRQVAYFTTKKQGRVQEIKIICCILKSIYENGFCGRYDDWDDEDYGNGNGDNDISFDSGDDEAIIYHLKLVERKNNGIKKRKIKRREIETEFPKRPRKLYAAATQTKSNNGYEDNDDDDNSNSNVSLSSRERKTNYEFQAAKKMDDNVSATYCIQKGT